MGSERKGPVRHSTLAKLLASGDISAETYVWQPGMDNWIHLGDVDALKLLVEGVGGADTPEPFVEEDTTFTTAEELLETHSELSERAAAAAAASAVDDAISEDTVVESVDDFLASGALAGAFGVAAAADAPSEAAETVDAGDADIFGQPTDFSAEAPTEAISDLEAALEAEPDDGLFGASDVADSTETAVFGTLEDSGDDLFSAAPAELGDSSAEDLFGPTADDDPFDMAPDPGDLHGDADIFGSSDSVDVDDDQSGMHSRRQSSVLFSLDELGREEAPASNDPFVTDSSGLIDIRAIASSAEDDRPRIDPFAGANLVIPTRSTGTVAVPIVRRQRGAGPWILAAAALLLVGGGVLAFLLMQNKETPNTGPAIVAAATNPPVPVKTPVKPDPKPIVAAVEADTTTGSAPDAVAAAVAADATDAAVAKAEGTASPATNAGAVAAVIPTTPPVVAAVARKPTPVARPYRPRTPRPATKPVVKPTVKPEPKPTPKVVAYVPPKKETTSKPENTSKVNNLLDKLNTGGGGGGGTGGTSPKETLPKRLSSATLKNTLKRKGSSFRRCGNLVQHSDGVVKVSTQFVIQGSTGQVKSARVTNASGTSAEVQRCVVAALKATGFPRFADTVMTVNYPIQLL